MEGVELNFLEDGVATIAVEETRLSSGARGLRGIVEEVLLDTMYAIPDQKTFAG